MNPDIDIEIIHTCGGDMHPPGWLVRVAGEIAVVAPLEDALQVAQRLARNLSRNIGTPVGITLVDERGAIEIARYPGAEPASGEAAAEALQPGGAPA